MRVLKSGEVRYKASAYKESTRLSAPITPMKLWPKGSHVKVYMGYGWAAGYVQSSDLTKCCIFLSREQRTVACVDSRNIVPFTK